MGKQLFLGKINRAEVEEIKSITKKLTSLKDVCASLNDTEIYYEPQLKIKISDEINNFEKEKKEWWDNFNNRNNWDADFIDFTTCKVFMTND